MKKNSIIFNSSLLIIYVMSAIFLFIEISFDINSEYIVKLMLPGFLFIFYLIYFLIRKDISFIFSSIYSLFYWVGIVTSSYFVNRGGYMYEIGFYGIPNGSFWLLIIFTILSFHFQYLGFNKGVELKIQNVSDRVSTGYQFYTSFIFVLLIIFICLLVLIAYGSPASNGVNRMQYWGGIAPKYLSSLRIFLVTTFFIVAYFIIKDKMYKLGLVLIFLYIYISIVLFDEKFSIFILLISIAGVVIAAFINFKLVKYVCALILIIITAMTFYVGKIYVMQGLGAEFILTRLTLQSQLIWSTLNESSDFLWRGVLVDCFPDCGAESNPGEFFSERYLDPNVYVTRGDTGTVLSGFTPAVIILYFGVPAALIMQALFSLLLGIVQGRLIKYTRNNMLFFSFLYSSLYYFLTLMWYVMNLNLIKISIVCFMLILIYKFLFFVQRRAVNNAHV